MPRHVKKTNLPQKDCVTCGRPFTWRKKWEKVWDEVRYCSDRCRRERPKSTSSRQIWKSVQPRKATICCLSETSDL